MLCFIKKLAVLAAIASLTSSCAMYRLEELRNTTPTGSPFQQALAKLYMDFATEDEKGYDWFNSWYFADKGLRSAYGKDVPPEDLKDWDIPNEALPDLQKAHGDLLVALTSQNETAHPEAAAQAQFYFDCWVQRQDENWQFNRIAYCRSGFMQAMAELGASQKVEAAEPVSENSVAAPKKHKHKHKTVSEEHKTETGESNNTASGHAAEQKPASEQKSDGGASTMSFVVFFASDQPVITATGKQVLADVIKSLSGATDYEIVIKGGTGSSASKLFAERADVVTKQLIAGGIKADAIMTGTGKGTAARHIEIFISQ